MPGFPQEMLNQFDFPEVARQDFIAKGLVGNVLAPNVTEFQVAGSDKGVAYRFFIHQEKNAVKSEEFDVEIFDDIEMIEWFVNRDSKFTERCKFLPDGLLKFRKNKITNEIECVSGIYKEAYLRFKAGLGVSGLELARWNQISNSQIRTLNSEGIFTVEQFAAMSKDRVEGRFPQDIVEVFHAAIQHVNAKNPMIDVKRHAEEMLLLRQETAKAKDEVAELKAKFDTLLNKKLTPKKTWSRKKGAKNTVEPETPLAQESVLDLMKGE